MSACGNIKALYDQLSAESYSGACQAIEIESFERTVSGFKPLTIFARKLHRISLTGF